MADEAAKRPVMGQPGALPPETSVGRQGSLGVELGMPLKEGEKPKVEREPDHGLTAQFDQGGVSVKAGDPEEKPEGAGTQPENPEADPEKKPEGETGQAEPLPDFDAEKPEVVEAYTKAYVKEDGSLNEGALTNAWMANAKVDPKTGDISGSLTENDYKFLASKGISKEMAKQVEAGQVAKLQMDRQVVFTKAGGAEKYNAAIAWARGGGYNDAAKAKFNADLDAGGATRDDAIDLLMQRYGKANPAPRRRVPEVSAAQAGNAPGGGQGGAQQGYPSYAHYQAELRASRSGREGAPSMETVRAKLKASPWYSASGKK